MLIKITNCRDYRLEEAAIPPDSSRFHLYILESLSPVQLIRPKGQLSMQAYDILLAQSLTGIRLQSADGSPLLLRLYGISFDLPAPLNRYAVGDNPLIHDLMNEAASSGAQVLFTNLRAKVCHAYLDAIEQLEGLAADTGPDPYLDFQVQKVAGLLFTELLRDHERKVSKSASQFPTAQVKYASRETQSGAIMTYVTENIQTVTLKGAAAHFAYQPNYFSRLCQNLFGVTFNELKTTIKLELAKEQLRLTTKSLEQISQELGYKAVSNFHRNFKAQTGRTPRDYRLDSQLLDFDG